MKNVILGEMPLATMLITRGSTVNESFTVYIGVVSRLKNTVVLTDDIWADAVSGMMMNRGLSRRMCAEPLGWNRWVTHWIDWTKMKGGY